MLENQIHKSVKALYAIYGAMGLVFLYDLGSRGLSYILATLFCIFLIYFAYEKRSRVAATFIFIGGVVGLIDDAARAMGLDLGITEETFSQEALIIFFVLGLVSIVPAYLLMSWCFRYHKLNKSKTNWKNVIKLTAGIFVYCFALVIVLSFIFDPDAEPTALESSLYYLVVVAGLCRKLPGTAEYVTVVSE